MKIRSSLNNKITSILYLYIFLVTLINSQKSNSEDEDEENVSEDEKKALRSVVNGNVEFSKYFYNMLKDANDADISKINGNIVFSPSSISSVLGMLRSGATASRKSELTQALQLSDITDSAFKEGFSDLQQSLPENDEIDFKSAQRIYIPNTFKIREKFKEDLTEDFASSAGVRNIDFGKSVSAAQKINNWMSGKTFGHVKSIISPDSITKDTKMVLVSGVYFRGNWENSFKILNGTQFFYLNDTHATPSPMMSQIGQFKYANLPDMRSEAVAIPFAGDRLEYVVILPKSKDGLKFPVEEKMKGSFSFASIIKQFKVRRVSITLPKFEMESFWTFSYKDPDSMLSKMGLKSDPSLRGLLDYNGITAYPGLYLDKLIHKTVFALSENGLFPSQEDIEGGAPEKREEAINFKANHPFLSFVYDTETGAILLVIRKTF